MHSFEVVELLLRRFPFLISVLTVEKWSALHAACINGHADTFALILKFPFAPEHLKAGLTEKAFSAHSYISFYSPFLPSLSLAKMTKN
jgi:ankyrin repeat protein